MKIRSSTFLAAVLLSAGPVLAATEVTWDWSGDEAQIDRFEFAALDRGTGAVTQLHTVADPTARSFLVDGMLSPLTPATFYVLRACNQSACSDWSDTVYLPARPGRPRIS